MTEIGTWAETEGARRRHSWHRPHDITRSASAPSTTASRRPTKNTPFECAAALFSYDFVSGGVDYDTLESLHRGEVTEWTSALRRSGLFTRCRDGTPSPPSCPKRPGLLHDALLRDATR